MRLGDSIVEAAKLMGAGMATVGLVGAGAGVGVVFGCLVVANLPQSDNKVGFVSICYFGFLL